MWLTVQGKDTGLLSIRKWKTEADARGYIKDWFNEDSGLDFEYSSRYYDDEENDVCEDLKNNEWIFDKHYFFCGSAEQDYDMKTYYWYQLLDIGDYDDRIMIGGSVGCGMETNVITVQEMIDIWYDTEKASYKKADEDGWFDTVNDEFRIQDYNDDEKWFCSIVDNGENWDYVVIISKDSLEKRDWWVQEELYD